MKVKCNHCSNIQLKHATKCKLHIARCRSLLEDEVKDYFKRSGLGGQELVACRGESEESRSDPPSTSGQQQTETHYVKSCVSQM